VELYDLVIIGAGPAGYVGAIRSAQLGAKVCLIEKEHLGGICLNRGCIPTKSLVQSARLLHYFRRAEEFGIKISQAPELDLKKALERTHQKVVKTLVRGIESLLKSYKVELKFGTARFKAKDKVLVKTSQGEEELGARNFLIATGSSPARIPTFPVDGKKILTSDHLLQLEQVPKSILIIGAGAIGCEWAFILGEFGAEVTVVEMMPRALPTEDEMVGRLIARQMKKRKIKLIVEEKIARVEESPEGICARCESGVELRAEKILVSIGRKPNSDNLGLEELGVERDEQGFIRVNSRMETSASGIYASGDVIGGILLAHIASAEAKVAVSNALGGKEEMDYQVVPSVVFTDPEVASVGLRENQAKEKGLNYACATFPVRALGKAQAMGEIDGEFKLIFEQESKKLLGAHIIAPEASNLIHELALALKMGAGLEDIAHTIYAHPTLAEGIMECAEAGLGEAIHLPKSN